MNKITLKKYQEQLKKWQSKSLLAIEKDIRKFYTQLVKEVLAEIGLIYQKYEVEGELTYTEMMKFNRLKKFIDSLINHVNITSKTTFEAIETTLQESYEYSYYWMAYAVETGALAQVGYAELMPDIIDSAINNPIKGLTLSETLEKNRRDIIYKIQQNVTQGLVKGATYKQMATDLQTVLEEDYKKAIRIVRTETHRVNEQATLDSMQRANEKGIKSTKTWRNSQDSRVRKTPKANHRTLDGQVVDVDKMFNLGKGQWGIGPGNTGFAHHDINCRCFLVYDVVAIEKKTNDDLANVAFEDWKKTLK